MKHLIITGDDFGRNHRINEAIERAHEAGFLTQASLMVNEPCADEAVRIAQRYPALCVGLHLTLSDGRASARSPITDDEGKFGGSPALAGVSYALRLGLAQYLFCSRLARPIQEEIRAQFDRFGAVGLPPTYWDGHMHLHLHPGLCRLAVPIACEHGFHAMRIVREPRRWFTPWLIFEALSRAAIPTLQRHKITFTDYTFGLRDTGRMTTEKVRQILERLPEGVSEFYFHPGAEPHEFDYARLREIVEEHGIVLRNSAPQEQVFPES